MAIVVYRIVRLPSGPAVIAFSDDGSLLITSPLGRGTENYDQKTRYRVLSLESGKTRYLSAAVGQVFGDEIMFFERQPNKSFRIRHLDRHTFELHDRGSVEFNEGDGIFISPNGFFARARTSEFSVTDLQTGRTAKIPMPAGPRARLTYWRLEAALSSSRWAVSQIALGTGSRTVQSCLFAFENGDLTQLAKWTSEQSIQDQTDELVSLTADQRLEIRKLVDGSLVDSQKSSYPPGFSANSVLTAVKTTAGLIPFRITTPIGDWIYDYQQRQILSLNLPIDERMQEVRRDALLLLDTSSQPRVIVRRTADQSLLTAVNLDQAPRKARFLSDGRQFAVVFADLSVRIYDAVTGAQIRTYLDRQWVVPTLAGLVLVFVGWSAIWIRQSLRRGLSPLWDIAVIHGSILVAFLMRIQLCAMPRSPFHPLLIGCESLVICWGTLAMGWCYLGRGRWSVRILVPIVSGALSLLVGIAMFRGMPEGIAGFAAVLFAIMIEVGLIVWLLRRWGCRVSMAQELSPIVQLSSNRFRLPLRDLFALTFGIGLLMAVTRFVPFTFFPLEVINILFLLAASAAITTVVALWGSLSLQNWLLRAVLPFVVAFAASIVMVLLVDRKFNWSAWKEVCSFTVAVTIVTGLTGLLFRLRNWRIVWHTANSHAEPARN